MNSLNNISHDKCIQRSLARKSLYQLLHLLFSQPITLEIYKEVQKEGNIAGLKDLNEGGLLLCDFFNSDDLTDHIQNEQQEYYRLFIGPGNLLAPPWESVYRGHEKILHDFPALEVRNLYNRYTLQLIDQDIEAEDHIVLELEFMINLIEKSLHVEVEKMISLLEGQRIMLEEHLSKWVPQFSQNIIDNTSSQLFQGLARLLNDFIIFDSSYINECLTDIGYSNL